jgi:hypothetical protein
MNRKFLGMLAVAAMVASVSAHAQLTSVDGGAAFEDGNGLEFASTVLQLGAGAGLGTASEQTWVSSLDAENYGGYNNWTLMNVTQAALLFTNDCQKNGCASFAGLQSTLQSWGVAQFFLSTPTGAPPVGCDDGPAICGSAQGWYYWQIQGSTAGGSLNQGIFDTPTITADAIAVRGVNAPELNPASAASGLTLLLGGLAVMRGRRKIAA